MKVHAEKDNSLLFKTSPVLGIKGNRDRADGGSKGIICSLHHTQHSTLDEGFGYCPMSGYRGVTKLSKLSADHPPLLDL